MHYKLEKAEVEEWVQKNPNESVFEVPKTSVFIDNWALADYPQLEKIVLPTKLVEMGYKVFENSNNIKEITFANNAQKSLNGRYVIENGYLYDAFHKRVLKVFSQNEEIKISEGVKYLDRLCFAGLKNLKRVSLPSTLISMEVPFFECNSLEKIEISFDNEIYEVKDNCLYEKKHGILLRAICSKKEFFIPEYIFEIRSAAFGKNIESIKIHEKVKKINSSAGENENLQKWIKNWRALQLALKNEIKKIVNFEFSLKNESGKIKNFEIIKNQNQFFSGKIIFTEQNAQFLIEELEKVLSSKKNYSHISIKQCDKKDLILIIENHGKNFLKILEKLKENCDEPLLLINLLKPNSEGEYEEIFRMTKKVDFVKNFYNAIIENFSTKKSNLIETILEMGDLEKFYERVE